MYDLEADVINRLDEPVPLTVNKISMHFYYFKKTRI